MEAPSEANTAEGATRAQAGSTATGLLPLWATAPRVGRGVGEDSSSDHRRLFVLSAREDDQLRARDLGPVLPTLGTGPTPCPLVRWAAGSSEDGSGCRTCRLGHLGAGGPLRNTWARAEGVAGTMARPARRQGSVWPRPVGRSTGRGRCPGRAQPRCPMRSPGSAHTCAHATRTPARGGASSAPSGTSLLPGRGRPGGAPAESQEEGTARVLAGVGSSQFRDGAPSCSASRGSEGWSGPDGCLSSWPAELSWSLLLCCFCRRVSL